MCVCVFCHFQQVELPETNGSQKTAQDFNQVLVRVRPFGPFGLLPLHVSYFGKTPELQTHSIAAGTASPRGAQATGGPQWRSAWQVTVARISSKGGFRRQQKVGSVGGAQIDWQLMPGNYMTGDIRGVMF